MDISKVPGLSYTYIYFVFYFSIFKTILALGIIANIFTNLKWWTQNHSGSVQLFVNILHWYPDVSFCWTFTKKIYGYKYSSKSPMTLMFNLIILNLIELFVYYRDPYYFFRKSTINYKTICYKLDSKVIKSGFLHKKYVFD